MSRRIAPILMCLFWLSLPVVASAGTPKAKPKPSKVRCLSRELKSKDCWLRERSYRLRFLDQTIAWDDGTWHSVDPMPLSGDGVEWEKISFGFLGHHPIVQLWLWDKGDGEAGARVQSLHWYVGDAENQKFKILAEGVVRKRHQETPPAASASPPTATSPAAAQAGNPSLKPGRILYDPWQPHSLKVLKSGELDWRVGREHRILKEGG